MRSDAALAALVATLAMLALAACGACPEGDLAPLSRPATFAVILTTEVYDATAVSLLDADGALVRDEWVDSGSRPAGLAAALSGDVVLPYTPLGDGTLTLIDWLDTDVLDRVPMPSGTPVAQISLRGGATVGWSPNPLDAIALDATHVLVSRNNPNLSPAGALDRGSDLVVVDLAAGAVTSAVDLSFFDTDVGSDRAYARPDQLARAGTMIVVGLDRLTLGFAVAADGAVAVVDPATLSVTSVPLMPLDNCGQVRAVPGTSDVAVVCAGAPFADEAARARSAGVAHVRVTGTGSGGMLVHSWRASDHAGAPAPTDLVAVLDATHALVSARGDRTAGTTDRLMLWDLEANTVDVAYASTETFVIQSGAYDTAHARALVPEGALGVHLFGWDGAHLVDAGFVDPSPCRHLFARQVAAL